MQNPQASKLVVHIGPPKTGSTQLQALFCRNSDVLAGKSVTWLIPKSRFEKKLHHDYGLLSEEAIPFFIKNEKNIVL